MFTLSFHRLEVMAAPVISISSDTSEESVGFHAPLVILFGVIPAIIPAIPKWIIYLLSDSDPSEDSLPPIPDLPLVSPSGSSSHDTLAALSEFPLAPVAAPPWIH
ncbi:hypothetical protein Tco_1297846 [Tanacetum coccineum]